MESNGNEIEEGARTPGDDERLHLTNAHSLGFSRRRFLSLAGAGLTLGVLDPLRAARSVSAAPLSQDLQTRVWRATGASLPDPAPYDDMFQAFMRQYGVRAATFALARNGVPLFSRGYTWAECGYPTTLPTTLFRLASVSKAFTNAAIYNLSSSGRLDLETQVFPFLRISQAALRSQSPSPYINQITVQNLLDMAGGWNDRDPVTAEDGTFIPSSNFDPLFNMREIAQALGLHLPPTKWDIARYMYGEPLQFKPGTQNVYTTDGQSYSNFGYLLLGLVIETVTRMPYTRYLQQIVQPFGIADLRLGHTLHWLRYPNEVWTYDSPDRGPSAFFPDVDVEVPFPYGGDDLLLEVADAVGGLVTSAPSLTAFTHRYISWGLGYRPNLLAAGSVSRLGVLPGARSYLVNSIDNVDYAFLMNTGNFPGSAGQLDPPTALYFQIEAYVESHLNS